MASIRKCICCGKSYEYCVNCGKSNTPWKFNFDTEQCKELFNAVSGYNMGLANANTVKAVLDKYRITNYNNFNGDVRKAIQKAITEITSVITTNNKIETEKKPKVNTEVEAESNKTNKVGEEAKVLKTDDETKKIETDLNTAKETKENPPVRRRRFV